jgi:hypothetical protein
MYDLRALPSVKHLRAYGAFFLGSVFAFQVGAVPFSSSASGDSVTFSASSYAKDAAYVGASLAISAGAVYATQPATLKTIAGAVAPLVVRAAPVAGAIGSAVLACFGNPACVVVTAAAAAYVANELSYGYSTDPVTGAPVVTKTTPDTPGTYYVIGFAIPQVPATTRLGACQKIYGSGANVSQSGASWYCYNQYGQGGYGVAQLSAPVTGGTAPSTTAELSTAIGAKTDWASDSKITDLLEKIVKNTSQSIPLQVPTITGPTSIVDTPTVQTKPDGSTTTTSRTTNFGYVGPTATASDIVQITDRSPTGVVTGTTTTTAPTYASEQEAKNSYDIPVDEIPKTTKTITFSAENLGFAAGTCPANVNQVIAGKTVKVIDWAQNCNYVTTYAKPMIWALATFAALMIIFVGKPQ